MKAIRKDYDACAEERGLKENDFLNNQHGWQIYGYGEKLTFEVEARSILRNKLPGRSKGLCKVSWQNLPRRS